MSRTKITEEKKKIAPEDFDLDKSHDSAHALLTKNK